MLNFLYAHTDFKIIVASLSGAMVSILTQQRFDRYRRPVAFFISFAMGIIGADATLEIIRMFIPGVFSDDRSIGAFLCSALIITVIINITGRLDSAIKTEINKHRQE
ncbi:phage holin family protein [Pantoea sp. JV6]|uniref:phage holin family protein n=1 Tax=Pantoea TaxID=53335 RepID=UPI00221FE371|nr:phage holin family protein [Pantoea sp. JV6]MCW0976986.1 phage holin family protein [Pantoea sp. JV6]